MGRSFFIGTETELFNGSRFFAEKIQAHYAEYGLSEAQALEYAQADAIWQAAFVAARNPAQRTRITVQAKNDAKRRVKALASSLAQIVAATASDEQKISLGLSVRDKATPVGELGQPWDFKMHLDAIGVLHLKWKNTNPASATGVVYQIWRRFGSQGEYTYLGNVGKKRYTDSTVPPGTAHVQYRVQAVRSGSTGPLATFFVQFGNASPALTRSTANLAA